MEQNNKTDVVIGVLTHCISSKSPERFRVMKECLISLEKLKKENTYIYVWDNKSSPDVREWLQERDFFDEIILSEENLYDVVAVHFLYEKAKKMNAKFVMHMEDDLFCYNPDFLEDSIKFMENNNDCGCLRVLKYEYSNKERYVKDSSHPQADRANWQRHFNCITKEPLVWEKSDFDSKYTFYKNNWHFYLFTTLCKTGVWSRLLPRKDTRPLQSLEGGMMKKYVETGLSVGILDGGAFDHRGIFNEKTSARLKAVKESGGHNSLPVIKYNKVIKEIEKNNNEGTT